MSISMRRLGLAAFLCLASSALLGATAQADVYQGSKQFAAPVQPPSLSPEPPVTEQHPYVSSVSADYDGASGTVTFSYNYFEPGFWASYDPYALTSLVGGNFDEATLAMDHCNPPDPAPEWPTEYLSGDTGETHTQFATEGTLTLSGYAGQVSSWETFDGASYSVTFQSPAFANLPLNCATISVKNIDVTDPSGDEPTFPLTDVTNPPPPPPPPAPLPVPPPAPVKLSPTTATAAFRAYISALHQSAVFPTKEGKVCPEIYSVGGPYSLCFAEYRTSSHTWHLDSALARLKGGIITFSHVTRGRWQRKWTHCSLRGQGGAPSKPGTLISNNDCGRAAPQSDAFFVTNGGATGSGSIGWDFTQSAGFNSVGTYHQRMRGRTHVFTNALGDSFQYTP